MTQKDDSTPGTRRSPMATLERLLCSIRSFHTSLRLLRLITPGEMPRLLVTCVPCQGLIGFFVNLLVAEARDFHCSSHVVENLGKKIIASDHAAVRFAIQKPTNRGHQSQRIPSWMSKHPIFCSIVQQLHDNHRFSNDRFCALAEFEDILHHAKKISKREPLKQTPTCIGKNFISLVLFRVRIEIDTLGH